MDRLKDKLDSELRNADFELDREAVRDRYAAHRRRRRGALIAAASFVIIIGLVRELMLSGPKDKANTSPPDSSVTSAPEHSFVLSASAAEVSEEYMESLSDEDRALMLGTLGLSTHGCKINVEYIENPMMYEVDGETFVRRFKTLRITGNTPIIAFGEDIEYLVYHSDNSAFYSPQDGAQVNDKKVAYDAVYPMDSALYWLLPEGVGTWIEDMQLVEGEVDFSQLPRDRITVTAIFTDGTELTRKMDIWFNDYGYLVVQDEDGTVYNDYSDVGEHKPFSAESGVITYDNVERITVTLNDEDHSEIEVANISPFISAVNGIKLYEDLPHSWITDGATTIRIELKDGKEHTVKIAMYCIRIVGDDRVYRADYDSVDELLSLCYGLLEKNDGSTAVYGDYSGSEY